MISMSLWRLQGSNTGLLLPTTSSNYPDLAWVHSSFVGMCFKSTTMHSMKCRSLKWLPKAAHQTRLTPLCMWKKGVCGSIECIELRVSLYIYIYCIYTTQYIILYWHTLSSCHFPTFKCVNGTGAWTCFEDMGFFSQKGKKRPPFFILQKNPCSQKNTRRKGDVTISTQPPTKQPRYELVMRKFEDVLGPRSEALRFRCFHSLLTWPLTGGQVPGLWVLKVWSGGKLTSEMQFWDRVYIHVYTIE